MVENPAIPTGWLTRTVVAVGMASLLSDVSHEMATTILPAFLALQIQAGPLVLGIIEGIADGLASYFKLIGGWFTDKTGRRKPVALWGYALTTIATAGFALAANAAMVLACRSLAWMARGWRTPARNALLADNVEPRHYGPAFGFERAMDTVGALIAPLLALALLEAGLTHREIFGLTLIPGLLAFAAMGLFVQEPYRHPQPDRTLLGDIKGLPRRFVVFVIIAGVFGLGQFAPTLLVLRATELTGSSTRAIELYVLFNIVQAAAAYLSGFAASRVRPMLLLTASYLAFALATAGFAVADGATAQLIVLFGIAGLAYGGIEAMEPTVAAHVLPSGLRGTGFGALGAANGVGDLLSSVIVGSLWTIVGPAAGFGFAAACSVASAGGLFILNARKP